MYFRSWTNIVTHWEVTGGTEVAQIHASVASETEGRGGGVGPQHCRLLPEDDLAGRDVTAGHAVPPSLGVSLHYEGIAVVQLGGSVYVEVFLKHELSLYFSWQVPPCHLWAVINSLTKPTQQLCLLAAKEAGARGGRGDNISVDNIRIYVQRFSAYLRVTVGRSFCYRPVLTSSFQLQLEHFVFPNVVQIESDNAQIRIQRLTRVTRDIPIALPPSQDNPSIKE